MFLEVCLCISVVGGLVVLLLLVRWKISFSVLNKYGIRGPPPELYYGNTRQLMSMGNINFIDTNLKKYGSIFGYFVGLQPTIVVKDFEVLKQILMKQYTNFINRPTTDNFLGIKLDNAQDIGASKGNQWKRQRKILSKSFTAGRLKAISPLIEQACTALATKLDEFATNEKSFNVLDVYHRFSLGVILTVEFGHKVDLLNGQEDEFADAINCIFDYARRSARLQTITLLSNFPFLEKPLLAYVEHLKVMKMMKYVKERATEAMQDRLEQDDSDNYQDLLQLLIDAKADSDEEDDQEGFGKSRTVHQHPAVAHSSYTNRLSEAEIIQNAILFIAAGSDTASDVLGYTSYLLAINPNEQEKAIKEIDEYFQANPDASLYEASQSIKYVEMVLEESSRLYPTTPTISRLTVNTTVINGITFPQGCIVSAPITIIHYSPDIWPEPTVFRPERFTKEEKEKRNPMAHMPFGYGPRQCIAMRLALMEVKMALIAILKEYRFMETPDTEKPLKLSFGFSTAPTNGIYLKMEKR